MLSVMEKMQQILERRLLTAKARAPHFSQRAFAKKIGLSSGALSEILRGKRPISKKLTQKLASKLSLSPAEKKSIGLDTSPAEPEFVISSDSFQLISDWWHFAILNLLRVKGFKSQPSWIAKRLGISLAQTEAALDLLLRSGMLVINGKKEYQRVHARLNTSDDVKNLAVRRSHLLDLELKEKSLELPPEVRDATSATFTIDPNHLPQLKKMIREFEDDLMNEAESIPGREVYRLSIHLFPLTKINQDGTSP
jgi:transcriptional regulator with XRE-family HTH domain